MCVCIYVCVHLYVCASHMLLGTVIHVCVYPYMCASHILPVYSDTCVCFTHAMYVQ